MRVPLPKDFETIVERPKRCQIKSDHPRSDGEQFAPASEEEERKTQREGNEFETGEKGECKTGKYGPERAIFQPVEEEEEE